jgi:heptaprenyl diphosphate synthase
MDFYSQVSAPLARLEEGLAIALDTTERPMEEINRHLLGAPGKRIRPALFFLALGQWNQPAEKHLSVALAIELIHTASLVHDDVIDKSEKRRRQSSVNHIWGSHTAVLTGDYLFAKAFRLLSDYGDIQIIREMASLVEDMSEGEIQQQEQCFLTDLTQAQYYQRIGKKTARFFSACARCAGLVSRTDASSLTALSEYGFNIGMAFQLIDDLLDFYGDEEKTGKPVAEDLRQGILTLPILHLLSVSPRSEELAGKITSRSIDAALVADINREMDVHRSADYVRDLAAKYVKNADLALESLPATESRETLSLVSRFIIDRSV